LHVCCNTVSKFSYSWMLKPSSNIMLPWPKSCNSCINYHKHFNSIDPSSRFVTIHPCDQQPTNQRHASQYAQIKKDKLQKLASRSVYRNPVSVDIVRAVDIFQRQQLHARAVVRQNVSETILGAVTLQLGLVPRLIATNKLEVLSTMTT